MGELGKQFDDYLATTTIKKGRETTIAKAVWVAAWSCGGRDALNKVVPAPEPKRPDDKSFQFTQRQEIEFLSTALYEDSCMDECIHIECAMRKQTAEKIQDIMGFGDEDEE